jgi:hypothetical protein
MARDWGAYRENLRWENVRARLLAHAPADVAGSLLITVRVADVRLAVKHGDLLEEALEELELLKGRVDRARRLLEPS